MYTPTPLRVGVRGLGDEPLITGGRTMDVTYFANLILAGRGAEVPATLAYAMLPDISRGSGLTLTDEQIAQKNRVLSGDYVGAYGPVWNSILADVMAGAQKITVPLIAAASKPKVTPPANAPGSSVPKDVKPPAKIVQDPVTGTTVDVSKTAAAAVSLFADVPTWAYIAVAGIAALLVLKK